MISRPSSTLATQSQDATAQEKRSCPRCGEDNVGGLLRPCGLDVQMPHEDEKTNEVCGEPIAKPLTDRFCTKCQTKIVQVPYDGPLVTRTDAASTPAASPFDERAKVVPFAGGKG